MNIFLGFLLIPIFIIALAILIQNYFLIKTQNSLKTIELLAEKSKLNFFNANDEKFKIEYSQNDWNELLNRLNNTRYFNQLDDKYAKKFEFGFDVDYAKELVNYWKTNFNWQKQIDILNKFSHYKIRFDDITLHYVRVNDYETKKKENSKKIPLLLLSGWPGSFYEFYEAIDFINKKYNNDERYFDIIIPSIPGYAYSSPLYRTVDGVETARLYDALMRHLFGENIKYYVHGEDWGSIIAVTLSQMYPSHIKGSHITMATPPSPTNDLTTLTTILLFELFPSYFLTQEEKEANITFSLVKRIPVILRETGYMHIQATKPDTVGFGLTDSPVGLMAYILEKYSTWSNNYETEVINNRDGSLNKFSKDDLLTIVTLYWMTNTITSSMRYYKCNFGKTSSNWFDYDLNMYPTPKSVPFAITYAPNEIDHSPYALLKKRYSNLVQYKITKAGGHFGLFDNPNELLPHLINFIDNNEN